MRIQCSSITVPITKITGTASLPAFRDRVDRPIRDGGLLPEERLNFAKETGFRVLPYQMQDIYEPIPKEAPVKTIVMENECLRATFLPSLGGRLYSLWDKVSNRELLFCNPVIKMGNLALRNAWFSGGIEWNFGHYGHTYFTCEDVFFSSCRDDRGGEFLRMYVYERLKRLAFQVDFHLPEGSGHLIVHMRITNPNPEPVPIFLWTNTAVVEEPGARVFSGTREVIFQAQSNVPGESRFMHDALPFPGSDGIDHTYPSLIPHAEEYFFQNPQDTAHAFESILYPDGKVMYERSTGNFPYRKMFCWGCHKGGKRWQEHLSRKGEGAYIEIQSGLFRSQQHTEFIGAKETIAVTQLFGGGQLNYPEYTGDYETARKRMENEMQRWLPPQEVEKEHASCMALAECESKDILHKGNGWGALEKLRDASYLPKHLFFPQDSLGEEQVPWVSLLNRQPFPGAASYMTAPEWLSLMEQALVSQPQNAELLTHCGIALYENGQREKAKTCWEKAVKIKPLALALRNLSYAAHADGDFGCALSLMEQSIHMLIAPEHSYAEEYLSLLNEAQEWAKAYAFYQSLPDRLKESERLSILACFSALEVNDDEFLDKQFARTFCVVKEGELAFVELWFRRETMREAQKRGVTPSQELLEEVKKTHQLPYHLDFRMLSE